MVNDHPTGNSTLLRTACAIVFVTFVFVYLYFFQSDLLFMVQHVLSEGNTHYDRSVGAVLITVALYLLQLAMSRIGRLGRVCHAFTYVPSLALLGALTCVSGDFSNGSLFTPWCWVLLSLVPIYVVVSLNVRPFGFHASKSPADFPGLAWKNLITLALMFLVVCFCGNTDRTLHYRLRMESMLSVGNYAEALKVGEKSDHTDESLTMLRVYALSRSGQLGERLFEYPVVGGSDALLPDGKNVECLFLPEETIFKTLSIRRRGTLPAMQYLLYIEKNGLAMKSVTDYILCGYLLDRDLDNFAKAIRGKYNTASPSLPRHYKEALTLYTRLRANPVLVYHDEVIAADYAGFQNIQRQYSDPRERYSHLRDVYGDTYWLYFFNS